MKQNIKKVLIVLLLSTLAAGIASCNKDATQQQSPPPKDVIVYADVNPDTLVSNGNYQIDLNNDGVYDFKITNTSEIVHPCSDHGDNRARINFHTYITLLNENEVRMENDLIAGYDIQVDSLNENIDSVETTGSLIWNNGGGSLAEQTHQCFYECVKHQGPFNTCSKSEWIPFVSFRGFWFGEVDKYIAVRLHAGSGIYYYGWVLLDVSYYNGQFTVKGYAYNSTPNLPIKAGQKK